MPFRAVESVAAAADSLATSALPLDFDVDCLAFGKKFRRGLSLRADAGTAAFVFVRGVRTKTSMVVSVGGVTVNLISNLQMQTDPPVARRGNQRWVTVLLSIFLLLPDISVWRVQTKVFLSRCPICTSGCAYLATQGTRMSAGN